MELSYECTATEETTSMETKLNNPAVYYKNNTWHCTKRGINENFETVFIEEGGFKTEEEANQAYLKNEEFFLSKIKELMEEPKSDDSFESMLLKWYHQSYVGRSAAVTKAIAGYVIYHFILPSMDDSLKKKALFKITSEELDSLIQKTHGYCESSQAQCYRVIRSFFADSVLEHYIAEDVSENMKKIERGRRKRNLVIYTKKQLNQFVTKAYQMDGIHSVNSCFFEILMGLLGLRPGEVRGLHVTDFDEEKQTLHIRRQIVDEPSIIFADTGIVRYTYQRNIKFTKTYSSERILQIPSIIFPILQARIDSIERQKEYSAEKHHTWNSDFDGYLVIGTGGEIKSGSLIRLRMKKICGVLGFPIITPHDLRHMTASWLLELGNSIEDIAAYLGHSDSTTTWEYYVHLVEDSEYMRSILENNIDPLRYVSQERGI